MSAVILAPPRRCDHGGPLARRRAEVRVRVPERVGPVVAAGGGGRLAHCGAHPHHRTARTQRRHRRGGAQAAHIRLPPATRRAHPRPRPGQAGGVSRLVPRPDARLPGRPAAWSPVRNLATTKPHSPQHRGTPHAAALERAHLLDFKRSNHPGQLDLTDPPPNGWHAVRLTHAVGWVERPEARHDPCTSERLRDVPSSSHNAASSALGYLYQSQWPLLELLRRSDERPDCAITLEGTVDLTVFRA